MSKLSTTLTVKNGSTTKTVNLYSSTSDMSNSSYTNEYLTCKCNGSTAYIAVASSGTDAYTNNGTALKYKNSSGTIKYILTEPYLPSTPSYSGTITIPAQTIYTNTDSRYDSYNYNLHDVFWTSSGFYLNAGDKVVIQNKNSTFCITEGTVSGFSTIDYSTYTAMIGITTSTSYSGLVDTIWSGGGSDFAHDGDDNPHISYYLDIYNSPTFTATKVGTYYLLGMWGTGQFRAGAIAKLAYDITVQVN